MAVYTMFLFRTRKTHKLADHLKRKEKHKTSTYTNTSIAGNFHACVLQENSY